MFPLVSSWLLDSDIGCVDESCRFKVSGQSEDEPHVSKKDKLSLPTGIEASLSPPPRDAVRYFISFSVFFFKLKIVILSVSFSIVRTKLGAWVSSNSCVSKLLDEAGKYL